METAKEIASTLSLTIRCVEQTLLLLQEGSTIPFLARYRKEVTGNLDEVQITEIRDLHHEISKREERRSTVLNSLAEQGIQDPSLIAQITNAKSLADIEDLYLPYRPKRTTRAVMARQRGLTDLASIIMKGQSTDLIKAAGAFINPDLGVKDDESALAGARDIIAEQCHENSETRQALRRLFDSHGVLSAKVINTAKNKPEARTFQDYFDYQEKAAKIPSHRLLAVLRAQDLGIVRIYLGPDEDLAMEQIRRTFPGNSNRSSFNQACLTEFLLAISDAWKRLIQPSLETEYLAVIKAKADTQAIAVFASNVRTMLLDAPFGNRPLLAVDPGFRTGCKLAVLNAQGDIIEHGVMYPLLPQSQVAESTQLIIALIKRGKSEAIAVGNGTGGREVESFLKTLQLEIPIIMVNEAGASIYSAGPIAREEFAELDLTIRSAISIGRRLMDPLAELVKIDPSNIGVGQYQHDVDQKRLQTCLDETVMSCVNAVGVELNTASPWLLAHVSGLGPKVAKQIVEHRRLMGPFNSRDELKKIKGLGPKTFEQCAGFLRINAAKDVLDRSAVHPERYELVNAMAKKLNVNKAQLLSDTSLLDSLVLQDFVDDKTSIPTLQDIIAELKKPGRDPRRQFTLFNFADSIHDITDLKPNMVMPGKVANVTAFGAFVDLGVHINGLIHISQLSDRYISDPLSIVKPGQEVSVQVLSIDLERKRIALKLSGISHN